MEEDPRYAIWKAKSLEANFDPSDVALPDWWPWFWDVYSSMPDPFKNQASTYTPHQSSASVPKPNAHPSGLPKPDPLELLKKIWPELDHNLDQSWMTHPHQSSASELDHISNDRPFIRPTLLPQIRSYSHRTKQYNYKQQSSAAGFETAGAKYHKSMREETYHFRANSGTSKTNSQPADSGTSACFNSTCHDASSCRKKGT